MQEKTPANRRKDRLLFGSLELAATLAFGYSVAPTPDKALLMGVDMHSPALARTMLALGAAANCGEGLPLRNAAASGDTQLAKLLLSRGANRQPFTGHALRTAVMHSHPETTELLLQNTDFRLTKEDYADLLYDAFMQHSSDTYTVLQRDAEQHGFEFEVRDVLLPQKAARPRPI